MRSARRDRTSEMAATIDRVGYYPEAILAAVDDAVAGEAVLGYVVQHEPTFDRDEVRRHVTVVLVTPTRLIVTHTDDHPGDDLLPQPYTATTTEAVALAQVSSVALTRMAVSGGPQAPSAAPVEAVLTVGWGAVKRVELEPAGCADPDCVADHGYTGNLAPEDLSVRISAAADGEGSVADLLDLSRLLSELTSGTR